MSSGNKRNRRAIPLHLTCASLLMVVSLLSGCQLAHDAQPEERARESEALPQSDHTHATPEELVRQFGADTLVADATQTTLRCRANTGKKGSNTIPRECWVGTIGKLDPIRAYDQRVNLVVVLESSEALEKGLYIIALHSSSSVPEEDESFTFKHIDKGVYAFERRRIRMQPNEPAEVR